MCFPVEFLIDLGNVFDFSDYLIIKINLKIIEMICYMEVGENEYWELR